MNYRMLNPTNSLLSITIVAVLLVLVGCAPKEVAPEASTEITEKPQIVSPQQLSNYIRAKFQQSSTSTTISINGKAINSYYSLPTIYQGNAYSALWVDKDGLLDQALLFLEILRNSDTHGLVPQTYYVGEIDALLDKMGAKANKANYTNINELAELDLLLTNAFLLYSHELLNGRVRKEEINFDITIPERKVDSGNILLSAIENNNIEEVLAGFEPKHPVYKRLMDVLERYREIASNGGWGTVQHGPKMKMGSRGPRVLALRERLIVTGDIVADTDNTSNIFDSTVDQGVRNFQKRNGLHVDGVVGKSTVESLNVPVNDKIRQIEINLERWRLLPQQLGNKYVLVNVANYHLYAMENNTKNLDMRIVVGKPEWNTPIFNEEMEYLVFNPYWNIPPSIFRDDILPRIKSDPNYLSKRNITIVGAPKIRPKPVELEKTEDMASEGDGQMMHGPMPLEEKKSPPPPQIDWSKVVSGKYRARQNPGPGNALGRIKFIFPNKHSVYLHDTPNRGYFNRSKRNFSHGCIRVEKPYELAEFVLAPDPSWTADSVRSAVRRGNTRTVHLPTPMPVYILYFTVWVDDQGNPGFHQDVYGLDRELDTALSNKSRWLDVASTTQSQ